MKILVVLTFIILCNSFSFGQTATELYNSRDYKSLIKLENNTDQLSSRELYMVGFAFFQLENDSKAIEFYDKAILNGLDDGSVHFYKGLSLSYIEQYNEALKEIDLALEKEPSNQEFMNQKGLIYKYQGQEDKALVFFEKAKKMPNTFGEPYFWVAYIYHGKLEFEKALELYYETLDSISKENPYYLSTLQSIGQLEYTFTKDYVKSARAYAEAVNLNPNDYEYYPKLIKAYNAAKQYEKADSIFEAMKVAYENEELSEEDMEFGRVAIDESKWNGQGLNVFRYFAEPKESLDISYKVYLISKAGDKVERTFMIEKTIKLPNGATQLLCEYDKKTSSHITYPYGWDTDIISLENLKKAVILVLDGKMKLGASSTLGNK